MAITDLTGTNTLSIGNKAVIAMYVGTKKVLKAYNGTDSAPFYEAGSGIDYSYENEVLTINNAPYSMSGEQLTIGE